MAGNCDYLYSDDNMDRLATMLVKQWGGQAIRRTDDEFFRNPQVNKLLRFVGDRVRLDEFTEALKQ